VSVGGGQDWGALVYLAAVGAVTLLMDWVRRRVMRHEDELDRQTRLGGQRHRRRLDRLGRNHSHMRWNDPEDLDG
jgi:hypothetical protein